MAMTQTPKQTPKETPKETPAPAVAVEAQMPPAGSDVAVAPPVPVLPLAAEATSYSEEKTETLMRAVVAYNKYHVRRVMKEDSRWFKGWPDLPVHEHQPLAIRRPDSEDDLLTYVATWRRREAAPSFQGAGRYQRGR